MRERIDVYKRQVPPFDQPDLDDYVRFALASAQSEDGSTSDTPAVTSVEEPIPVPDPTVADVTPTPTDDQLEPDTSDEEQKVKPDDHPVTSRICDWTISVLTGMLDTGQLDLQPQFQREYVWATRPELPSRLIESQMCIRDRETVAQIICSLGLVESQGNGN